MTSCGKILLILLWIGFYFNKISTFEDDYTDLDVDKFTKDYISEVKRTLKLGSNKHVINKRSHGDNDIFQLKDIDLLVGFQEVFALPIAYADLLLFSHCYSGSSNEPKLYAAALGQKAKDSLLNYLILFEYQGMAWEETHRVEVLNGVRLAAQQIDDIIYIIVAEHHAGTDRGSTVFRVNSDSGILEYEHTLCNTQQFPSHVIMWKWQDTLMFAAVANSENPPGSASRYSTQSPVYMWEGSHFDMMHTLPTYNPRALSHFNIRSSMFIAVANFQNDNGETSVDSDIFRYNVATNRFTLYQKLPTEAAIDIKYFCFLGDHISESFLIYASAYHTDEEGLKDYNTASVVYKLSDEEYFVPFQALRVSKITGWLPVRYPQNDKEGLLLLGATEEGVISYQYDGWRFVATGVYYDRSAFGPGLKSIRAFYYNNRTLISAANKQSGRYEYNVFSPVLRHHSLMGELQKEVSAWEEQMRRQVADAHSRVAALLEIALAAPTVNDPVVQLGDRVVFHDVEVENLITHKTRIRESAQDTNQKLRTLETQLIQLHQNLKGLKAKIDESTVHYRTVYDEVAEEPSADILCTSPCQAEQLIVSKVNGEEMSKFLVDTVDVREPVEIDELTFEKLALIDPLDTRMINGHPVDNVIDWSREVVLDHGLKIEGTLILNNNLTVGGTVDGVSLNKIVEEDEDSLKEVVDTFNKTLNTVRASQLVLLDGKLSEVDFQEFVKSTLKTQGDQLITEFQDFNRIEADEVIAKSGLYKIVTDPYLGETPCKGKSYANIEEGPLSEINVDFDMESNNIIEDEIEIPYDVVYHGTIIIENGTLATKDFIDSNRNISARNVVNLGIPLNKTVIDKHFIFKSPFKAENLTVDTINNVDPGSLMNVDSSEPVVVRARKEFLGDLVIDGRVQVEGTVNGVDLTQEIDVAEELKTVQLDTLTVHSINGSSITVNGVDWNQIVKVRETGKVYVKRVEVEEDTSVGSIMVRGHINNYNLEKLLQDTVYNDGKRYEINGNKHFISKLKISNLSVNTLNDVDMNKLKPNFVWKTRLSHAKSVRVGNLSYTGKLDGIVSQDFGEWLLTEGDQTLAGSQMIDTLQADHVTISPSGHLNNVNIQRLISDAIFITDNITLDTVIFEGPVSAAELWVGGRLSGLRLPEDVVLSDTSSRQQIVAHKHVLGSVTVLGDLRPVGLQSSFSLASYCDMLTQSNTSLVVQGNAVLKEEPFISDFINNRNWTDLMKRVWLRHDDRIIQEPVLFYKAQFGNLEVETINSKSVKEVLSNLVSLSEEQTINGTLYFSNVTMLDGLEVVTGHVERHIQGLHLQSFIEDVMLDGEDQHIWGYPNFKQLIVDGILVSSGHVNNLNLSQDLLLANSLNNTITGSLSLHRITTDNLTLPSGSLVADVDLEVWNSSAVKRSVDNTITGNIVCKGDFGSSSGIKVEGLVNGIRFDKDHVMLRKSSQRVTGLKMFSSGAKLDINRLQVRRYLNNINITEFYDQQVINEGNITLSGPTRFTSPLHCNSVSLPEIYQGHNLTWLEDQLACPLPRASYQRNLAQLLDMKQLAEKSLAGRAFYLKSITRMRDIRGMVLYAVPFQTDDATLVAAVRNQSNRTSLSLLHWNASYRMFLDKPGSTRHILNTVPSDFQSVVMSSGEMAGYVTRVLPRSGGHGEFFRLKNNKLENFPVKGGQPSSQLFSFRDNVGKTCFLLVTDICSVYCTINKTHNAQLPSFPCHHISQATLLTTNNSVYLLGVQGAPSNSLIVWKLSGKRFFQVLSMHQFNPVSIAATTTTGPHIAVATRHLVGNTHPETIDIYRFKEELPELQLEQRLPTISPKNVLFAELPSGESVLYVASDNPASPLEVFLYRGILGYLWFAVEASLPCPVDVHAVTDHDHRHFVIVTSDKRACVLQAQFEGEFAPSKI